MYIHFLSSYIFKLCTINPQMFVDDKIYVQLPEGTLLSHWYVHGSTFSG